MATISLPSGPFTADVRLPGDKSLGHRALVLAGIAEGTSTVRGLSTGADIRSTKGVLRALGLTLARDTIRSRGFDGWIEPAGALDCGNSGTTMRLMIGALSAARFDTTLTGDASLLRRPMRRLVGPIHALGGVVEPTADGHPPVTVRGGPLIGTRVRIPVASAQVRTAVALAALHATGPTAIDSPPGFRDHTEHWLVSLGRAERLGPTLLRVDPGPIPPLDVTIPGDPSSAAFLWAAAAVRPGSRVTTRGISLNPGRLGFLRLLERMGAEVHAEVTGQVLGDPVGDVAVHAPTSLRGVRVASDEVAASVDELPLLAVVAATAQGTTTVMDAAELRVKESDRLTASIALARLAGGRAALHDDGFAVGTGEESELSFIATDGDHRVAMAAAIAAIVRDAPVEIDGFEACAVSWPGFETALEGLWS